ncbi:type III pantothenate kinase [Costertonia aggregata]|uniref:Type III pantothenate kinase n=1 Tax=Costertonia aggregata TaxID=343403 RepID=A0A7H9AQQ5_9FLAO|nr:type III pantothenate kinase [Costertonia aggregata]QLG45788.1 type III pantothenate kinase [Costertonia aggregata]
MNLIIDAGNTLVKLAVFNDAKMIFDQQSKKEHVAKQVKEVCDHYPQISHSIISSVSNLDTKVKAVLSIFSIVHELGHNSKTPFKNSYATPQTLGVDRMALATAAFYHNPHANTLVIDAGTCITFDMLNDYGEYLGGAISPGIQMRYKAMNEHTAKLPLLKAEEIHDFIGNTTEKSMHSGVVNGVCNEIDGVIHQYKSRFEDLTVILTGGDALFLSKRLKNTIFAHSNFLLQGLNYLLEYNKQ